MGATQAFAVSTVVRYSPPSHGVFGVLPAVDTWPVTITAPGSGVTFPITVRLRVVCTDSPVGDFLTPLSYISFGSPTVTFNAPGDTQTVNISANFPLSALTMNVTAGTYAYTVSTEGWPAGITDNGTLINASVSTIFPPPGNPPTTTIDSPADGTVFTYALTSLPATIPFTFHGVTDDNSPVITEISASLAPQSGASVPIPVVVTGGLGTSTVTAAGNFTVTAPGTYVLEADTKNLIGTGTDTNTYTVTVTVAPPTVAISSPTPNANYTYRAGNPPTLVPFTFAAHSNYGGIRTLVAFVDGVQTDFVPQGIGTLDATGSITLSYTAGGSHTVSVTTTDDYGNASAASNFTVNYVAPTPTINITAPTTNQVFTIPAGQTSINVPYAFTTTSNNGFVVDTVSATLGSTAITPATTGLGTATAKSTGTLNNLVPGTYTLTANGSSAGIPVQQSVTFTVQANLPPPSVVINSPAPNASFTKYTSGPALTIPLTFTGTSNYTNGVIIGVTAKLDGQPLAVSATLNQKVVIGTATMTVSTAGTHTIVVTATDAVGTATASQTFTVKVVQGSSIAGTIFFDVDTDGVFDPLEFGLAGITVNLRTTSGQVLASTTSAANGTYSFSNIAPGNYVVAASAFAGLTATNGVSRSVTVGSTNVTGVNIGFMLDFCALQGMPANGYTIGYWKNNIDKAIKGSKSGVQVSAATLTTYTSAIGSLALSPYDNISMKTASATMASTSSSPTDLLSKQLIAAEYNYENKAYLKSNGTLTYLFVWWGEYVLSHPSSYSSSYILWAKDWFDAYNNTHGAAISGPALLGTSCNGSSGGSSTGGHGETGGSSGGGSCSSGYDSHSGSYGCDNDSHGGSYGGSCDYGSDNHNSSYGGYDDHNNDCYGSGRDSNDSYGSGRSSGNDCDNNGRNDHDNNGRNDHDDNGRNDHGNNGRGGRHG